MSNARHLSAIVAISADTTRDVADALHTLADDLISSFTNEQADTYGIEARDIKSSGDYSEARLTVTPQDEVE